MACETRRCNLCTQFPPWTAIGNIVVKKFGWANTGDSGRVAVRIYHNDRCFLGIRRSWLHGNSDIEDYCTGKNIGGENSCFMWWRVEECE